MHRLALFLTLVFLAAFTVHSQSEPSVLDLHFVGNERVDSDELIHNFSDCIGDRWKQPEQRLFEYFAEKCSKQLMFSKGFWRAKITGTSSLKDGEVVNAQIGVMEGPRYRLGEVQIKGCDVIPEKEVRRLFGQTSGDVADGRRLEDFLYDELKEQYDELGYVEYSADFEPYFHESTKPETDGTVDIVMTIDEGRQFHLLSTKFVGFNDDDTEFLRKQFIVKRGEIYSTRKIREAIERINDLDRFPRIDSDQDVELRLDEESSDVELVIKGKP